MADGIPGLSSPGTIGLRSDCTEVAASVGWKPDDLTVAPGSVGEVPVGRCAEVLVGGGVGVRSYCEAHAPCSWEILVSGAGIGGSGLGT